MWEIRRRVVREEGDTDTLWETLAETHVPSAGEAPIVEVGAEIESSVISAGNRAEDIALVQNPGLEVDDDNDPSPKNIPTEAVPSEAAGRGCMKASHGAGMGSTDEPPPPH